MRKIFCLLSMRYIFGNTYIDLKQSSTLSKYYIHEIDDCLCQLTICTLVTDY